MAMITLEKVSGNEAAHGRWRCSLNRNYSCTFTFWLVLKKAKNNKLLSDKLESNLGYVYENVVAQMLIAKGNNLFYYTMANEVSNRLYEIDFLMSVGDKISPIEVKSGNYRSHKSLDIFCDKFSSRIKDKYVIHTKDYKWENGINYIPVYMVPFL